MTGFFPWSDAVVSEDAIAELATRVRADPGFLLSRRAEIQTLVRKYIFATWAERPHMEAPDAKALRQRHLMMAAALASSAESMRRVVELLDEDRRLRGPMHMSLLFKLGQFKMDAFEEFASFVTEAAATLSQAIRDGTPSKAQRKRERRSPRGRTREEGFREFVNAMASLCGEAGGRLYGGNAKRAHNFAEGLSQLLSAVHGAPRKTPGAIEEVLRPSRRASRKVKAPGQN